jgi:tripartite-type tricarboxylate transporter receptor subunit TctC
MESVMTCLSRRAFIAGCATTLAASAGTAQDQSIRIVYPFAAGGAIDAVARLLAEQLRASLSRPVIVDNRTGAGGRTGVKAVTQAEPDGATLLFATGTLIALQPHIYPTLGYDPMSDLHPVSHVMQTDLALAVGSGVPARGLEELKTWAQSNAAQAFYGSPGAGTSSHFVALELARLLRLELRHVPYRGTGAAMPDLLGGRVPMYIAATPELIEQHRAGRIRIMSTTGSQRSVLLPDVPTLSEQGLPIVAPLWAGVYVPARTPNDVVERLNGAIVSSVKRSEVSDRIRAIGFQPTGTSSEELRRIQKADFDFWSPIVKASGYTPTE